MAALVRFTPKSDSLSGVHGICGSNSCSRCFNSSASFLGVTGDGFVESWPWGSLDSLFDVHWSQASFMVVIIVLNWWLGGVFFKRTTEILSRAGILSWELPALVLGQLFHLWWDRYRNERMLEIRGCTVVISICWRSEDPSWVVSESSWSVTRGDMVVSSPASLIGLFCGTQQSSIASVTSNNLAE